MEEAEHNYNARLDVERIYNILKDKNSGLINSKYLSQFDITNDMKNPDGPITIVKDGVPIKFRIAKYNMKNLSTSKA